MTKLFATGVTGYVGGDAIYVIAQAHPEYEITVLVRDKEKGAKLAAVHPNFRIVYGDLDDPDLVEEEASKADIIARTFTT